MEHEPIALLYRTQRKTSIYWEKMGMFGGMLAPSTLPPQQKIKTK